jgi:hypothetical protein
MRTVTTTTKIYTFAELSDEAKEKAVNNLRSVNLDHYWWDGVYDDAKCIGLRLTSFDLDRNRHAKGEFIGDAHECAVKIVAEHGEQCETRKTAQKFLSEWDSLVEKHSDGVNLSEVAEGNEYEFDCEADDLEKEFLRDLCEDYSILLEKEYYYLSSDEAVIESIEANGYEFTEDGDLF